MQRNDRWYGSSAYRQELDGRVVGTLARPEPRESRPVFMVNPSIVITINDDMAADIVAYLQSTMDRNFQMPSHVFAFMKQLENDLARA